MSAQGKHRLSRRELLRHGALGVGAVLLAACQPKVVEKEKIVKETVVIEGTPQVVEKVVTVQSSQVPTAAPNAPVKLVAAWWGPPGQTYAYEVCVQDYKEKNPHVSIDVVTPGSGGYEAKILTMVGAGEVVDVLLLENDGVCHGPFWEFAPRGVVADLSELAAQAEIRKEQFLPGAWETSSYEGKLYGIPYDMNAQNICYNADMFKEAGVPNPQEMYEQGKWDYDGFLDLCKRMTNLDKKIYGIAPWRWSVWPFIWMFGGRELSEDGKTVMLNDPKTIKGYESLYDLSTKHKVAPTTSQAIALGDMFGIFAAKQAAMCILGNWDLLSIERQMNFDWNFAPMPKGPEGRFVWRFTGQWGIGSQSKSAADAFEVVKAFTSVEGMKLATIMKVGRTAARQEVVDKYYYGTWQGKNVKSFVDLFPCGRAFALGGPFMGLVMSRLDLVMEGKQSVAEALELAQADCQAELDKGEAHPQLDMLKYGPGCD